ncbi:ABC transporter ATP-binding protein [Tissierella praeacuta]|uniref:ABC transporter ATP-binding protein n=1 Tax=Tissierella praeacuta TaxID=43131 RepID=UPI0033403A9D
MKKTILTVKNLTTYYNTKRNTKKNIVDDVSFTLKEGEILGIAGESGCGKSTLALSIMGYYTESLHYEKGTVILDNEDISALYSTPLMKDILGKELAYVPQAAMNTLNPTNKIIRFVEDVIQEHNKEMTVGEIREIAEDRLNQLNLPHKILDQYPIELSGGMRQRVVIAVATLLNPKVIITDEPTSALDITTQKAVAQMFFNLMEKHYIQSAIFISHELPLLYNISDTIAVMYAGKFVEMGLAEDIVKKPNHKYTNTLMSSVMTLPKDKGGSAS